MKFYILLILYSTVFFFSNAQEHGIIVGLSRTGFKTIENVGVSTILNYKPYDFDNNIHLGYQFRHQFSTPFLIDAYGLVGVRTNSLKDKGISYLMNSEGVWIPEPENTLTYLLKYNYFSIGTIVSYKIWKELHFGLGFEPTCYYKAQFPINKTSHYIFDVPLVMQFGYSFKYFDIFVAYKKGNNNLLKDENFHSLKTTDLQFSVFVPMTNFNMK